MSYTQRITIRRPRPKRLWGMGDGPVTSPSDPSLEVEIPDTTPSGQVVAGTVGPTRVSCDALPADSPFRGPSGPCPALTPAGSIMDWLRDTFGVGEPAATVVVPAAPGAPAVLPAPADSGPPIGLIAAAALGVGYYLYAKRKKKRSA